MKKYTKKQKENIFIAWFLLAAIIITVIIVKHFYDVKVIDKEERYLRNIKVCQAYEISKHGDFVTVYVNDKWENYTDKQQLKATADIQRKLNKCNEYSTKNVDVVIRSANGKTTYTHADYKGNVETCTEYMLHIVDYLSSKNKKKITITIDG